MKHWSIVVPSRRGQDKGVLLPAALRPGTPAGGTSVWRFHPPGKKVRRTHPTS